MQENNQNRGKGYHVTIVDNNTGKVVHDGDTRAIMYAMTIDNEDEIREFKGSDSISASGTTVGSVADQINIFDMMGLVDGLQHLVRDAIENHPMLEVLARVMRQDRTVIKEAAKEDKDE
jgi:hypothetical protein